MKKLLKTTVLLIILLSLSVGAAPQSEAYTPKYTTMKIGLYYNSEALPSANLLNYVGSGYEFGYFDSSREFHCVGYTDETALTMMKDWNMYLSGGLYYDAAPSGTYSVVGCYHIQLNTVYASFDEAKASAGAITAAPAFPAYYSGKYYVCVGNYTSYSAAVTAMGTLGYTSSDGVAMSASSNCIAVVKTGTTNILFEFDYGNTYSLAVNPRVASNENAQSVITDANGFPIEVKPQTWFKGYKYYGAFQYARLTGENITVVNYVNIEDYVKGVIPYEMSASWPLEALKAQALCARTYVASHFNAHSGYGFDLCNTADCQVYRGTNSASSTSDAAVDATAGKYILHNGTLCETYYHSSSGGATENSENVWRDTLLYLRGVSDEEFEKTVSTGYRNWSVTYTAEQLTWLLQSKGYSNSDIVSVSLTYTDMGNVYSVKFTDSRGISFSFPKNMAKSIFYSTTLKKEAFSQRFTITSANLSNSGDIYVNGPSDTIKGTDDIYAIGGDGTTTQITGGSISVMTGSGPDTIDTSNGTGETVSGTSYTLAGSGWGHNIGMSQYGAYAMAKLGYTYEQIIKFYFTGVTIG